MFFRTICFLTLINYSLTFIFFMFCFLDGHVFKKICYFLFGCKNLSSASVMFEMICRICDFVKDFAWGVIYLQLSVRSVFSVHEVQ